MIPSWLKEERDKLRAKLEQEIENNLVVWDDRFVPKINMDILFRIIKKSKKFPDLEQAALEKLVEEGLISHFKPGNWDITVRPDMVVPGYSVNPILTRNILYFTSREDCERFQKRCLILMLLEL